MFEFVLLLLPVAAASGWFFAKASGKKSGDQKSACAYDPDYYKGLNFLLNEQPDKAIDVFIHLLEVDSETVETHLALGSLFRKRGEVDRAIRIHQNLIARPSLAPDQRANALLELGQDYMHAGLFDRAENLFSELYETGKLQKQALENLREIYQQEKVWEKCLQVANKLESYTHKSYSEEIAHYYCELAELAAKNNDSKKVAELVKKAKAASSSSVRAIMMEAALDVSSENYKKALRLYGQLLEQHPEFVSEVLPEVITCYRHGAGQQDLFEYLNGLYQQSHNALVLNKLVELVQQSKGMEQALDYLAHELEKHPNLHGLKQMVSLKLSQSTMGDHDFLALLRDNLNQILSHKSAYQCSRCGFKAKTLHWQCPGCRSWGTIAPVTNDNHTVQQTT
ncbi:MAG: lipopolysaccharide assembly protein LapB [Chromatiales bacterium]|jgi:lipopolysaccharide biosynthesis regulator YciM